MDFTSIWLLIKQRRRSTLMIQKKLFNKCFSFLLPYPRDTAERVYNNPTVFWVLWCYQATAALLLSHTEMPYKYLGM